MKSILLKICLLLLIPIAGMGFVACSDNESVAPVEYIDQPGFHIEIRVKNTPTNASSSRAAGPSDEDGRYPALENEGRVSDATIFLYRSDRQGNGIQSTASTPIDYAIYVPFFSSRREADGTVYYTPRRILCDRPVAKGTYHIIAVCNKGDLTSDGNANTLGGLRNLTVSDIYREGQSLSDTYCFTMASCVDQSVEVGDFSPSDDPDYPNANLIELEASVERLAARIDFSPGTGTWVENKEVSPEDASPFTINAYEYPIGDGNNNDRFYLTAVTPVNLYDGDEYLLKRVSYDDNPLTNTRLSYLISETGNTNYVLDPNTLNGKNGTEPPAGMYTNPLAGWFGVDKIADCTEKYPVKKYEEGNNLFYKVTEDNGNHTGTTVPYWILSYAKENTTLKGTAKDQYVTGLVFSGYYAKYNPEAPESPTWIPKSYVYYIRHNDPTNSTVEALPMKYGIVRNHIYRIRLKSVSNLGLILIQVRDWIPVNAPEIDM